MNLLDESGQAGSGLAGSGAVWLGEAGRGRVRRSLARQGEAREPMVHAKAGHLRLAFPFGRLLPMIQLTADLRPLEEGLRLARQRLTAWGKWHMAQQGKRLSEQERQQVVRAVQFMSIRAAARHLRIDPKTVQKYRRKSF